MRLYWNKGGKEKKKMNSSEWISSSAQTKCPAHTEDRFLCEKRLHNCWQMSKKPERWGPIFIFIFFGVCVLIKLGCACGGVQEWGGCCQSHKTTQWEFNQACCQRKKTHVRRDWPRSKCQVPHLSPDEFTSAPSGLCTCWWSSSFAVHLFQHAGWPVSRIPAGHLSSLKGSSENQTKLG